MKQNFESGGNPEAFKEFNVEQIANSLGIAKEARSQPEVKEYLRLHTAYDQVISKVTNAKEDVFTKVPEADIIASHPQLSNPEVGNDPFLKLNITPGLEDMLQGNYQRVLPILEVGQAIVEEGLGVRPIDPEFISNKLNLALDYYGLQIESAPEDINKRREYGDKLLEHKQAYENVRKVESELAIESDDTLEYMVIARDPETKDFYPCGPVEYAPQMHEYTELINSLDELHFSEAEDTQAAQGDFNLSHWHRRRRLYNLTQLTENFLLDGMNGKHLDMYSLTSKLAYPLDVYHLHIVPKPFWERSVEAEAILTAKEKHRQEHGVAGRSLVEWQNIAKEYQIDDHLYHWGIAKDEWEKPDIREFTNAVITSSHLQRKVSFWSMKEEEPFELVKGEGLAERSRTVELLMRAVCEILEDGLQGGTAHPGNISEYIRLAIDKYGLDVTSFPEQLDMIPLEKKIKMNEADDPFIEYRITYGEETANEWFMVKDEIVSHEREKEIEQTAERLNVHGDIVNNPEFQTFLGYVHDAKQLEALFRHKTDAESGDLIPSIGVRYEECKELMSVASAILEQGFDGKELSTDFIQNKLTRGLRHFGLAVNVKSQVNDHEKFTDTASLMEQWKKEQDMDDEKLS